MERILVFDAGDSVYEETYDSLNRVKGNTLSRQRERIIQGEDFAFLASNYSIANSKAQGGDLGYITVDLEQKFQKFWEMAFSLERGKYSTDFQGPDGRYYIVKVEDIRGGDVRPMNEVFDDIKDYLKVETLTKKIDTIVSEAKQRANIIINLDLLR